MLLDALNHIRTIQAEAARIGTPPLSSGSGESGPLVPVPAAQVEATDLNYQLAVLIAARNTAAIGMPFGIGEANQYCRAGNDDKGRRAA